MSGNPMSLPLLGLAEELSASEVPVGDPTTEALVRGLLDRVTDAIVDVTLGRATLTGPTPPAVHVAAPPTAGADHLDPASCSALAVRCHRAAALLHEQPEVPLAASVAECLTTVADGLQRWTQDVRDARVPRPEARQHLRRTLRRAAAVLDAGAPLQ